MTFFFTSVLATRCLRWLQYHDRDTGDLCGMLPLAIGMQVALTQHLDRSVDKLLLKGTIGRVHSWQWNENDRLPSVVYVKFEKAAWQLDGIDEPGVYPVRPVTEDWYLDGRRSPSVLKIKRRQVPLSPAYAMTAHASQGKTLAAVLLDLNVDKRVDTTFGTVAASRVRCREDCLILRPFPQWLFQRGMNEGPSLLLQTLRGESIDWAAYREGRKPFASCRQCQQVRSLEGFEHEQWENVRKNLPAMCMRCKHGEGGPSSRKLDSRSQKFVCDQCKVNKIEDCFPRAQLKQEGDAAKKVCLSCCKAVASLRCTNCQAIKEVASFHPVMVTMPAAGVVCKACQEELQQQARKHRKGWFSCRGCKQIFPAVIGGDHGEKERCLNCASRTTRQKDEHTCRNKGCKRKFHEAQATGLPRKRFCFECRNKA